MDETVQQKEFACLRQAVLLGLFTGTGVGLGYLLAGIPGIELMSLNAALAGAALGAASGALAGALSVMVYSMGSPFGPTVPLLLASQVVGMALCGCAGAWLGPALRRLPAAAGVGMAAAAGLAAALCIDLLTNLAMARALDMPLAAVLAAGLPVAALHAVTSSAAFGMLLPPLGRRLQLLLRRAPRCSTLPCAACLILIGAVDSAARDPQQLSPVLEGGSWTAPADTLAPDLPDSLAPPLAAVSAQHMPGRRQPSPRLVLGWRRPLWQPFAGSLREHLRRGSSWLPVSEAGQGGATVYFADPGTASAPRWTRDGLPLDQGHRYLDDPEAIVTTGHHVQAEGFGPGDDGTIGDAIVLRTLDSYPDRDHLDTRWFKGAHETYLRDVHFLTARAPWRFGFAFGELLDNEGYDFRVPGESRYRELDEEDPLLRSILWGRSKLRSGHGLVQRDMGASGTLTLGLENVRKLKLALPAYGLASQDLWHNRASLDWRAAAGARPARFALWWLDSDVDWNRGRSSYRKQEGSSTGMLAAWGNASGGGRLDAAWRRWTLVDSGADTAWAGPDTSGVRMHGEAAHLRGARAWKLGPASLTVTAGAWWDEHGGWLLGGGAAVADERPRPRWSLTLERGGRTPRSDELATPWRFVVPGGRQMIALPNRDLRREDEWRLAAVLWSKLAGFDLALSGSVRRLRDGIGWRPSHEGAATGRWDNGLALDSTTMRARLAREGRCLGWIRLSADLAWRTWRQDGDLRAALPPALDWRLAALWEQHFFEEDGILQLAMYLRNRGPMDDPWFLAQSFALPAVTSLDMIVAFRLVGADLGLELLNVTGAGARLSAGSVDHGLELRWRLHWVFHY